MNSKMAPAQDPNREAVGRCYIPCKINGRSTALVMTSGGPATFMSTMLMRKLGLENWLNIKVTGTAMGILREPIPIVGVLDSVPVELTTGIVIRLKLFVFENERYDAIAFGSDMFAKYHVALRSESDGVKVVGMNVNGIGVSAPCLRYKDEVPPFAESVTFSPIYQMELLGDE